MFSQESERSCSPTTRESNGGGGWFSPPLPPTSTEIDFDPVSVQLFSQSSSQTISSPKTPMISSASMFSAGFLNHAPGGVSAAAAPMMVSCTPQKVETLESPSTPSTPDKIAAQRRRLSEAAGRDRFSPETKRARQMVQSGVAHRHPKQRTPPYVKQPNSNKPKACVHHLSFNSDNAARPLLQELGWEGPNELGSHRAPSVTASMSSGPSTRSRSHHHSHHQQRATAPPHLRLSPPSESGASMTAAPGITATLTNGFLVPTPRSTGHNASRQLARVQRGEAAPLTPLFMDPSMGIHGVRTEDEGMMICDDGNASQQSMMDEDAASARLTDESAPPGCSCVFTTSTTSSSSSVRVPLPPRLSMTSASSSSSRFMTHYTMLFKELKQVGKGNFGCVTQVMHRFDKQIYAVKCSRAPMRGQKDCAVRLREVRALAKCVQCPNIIRYFSSWIEDDVLYIQMEFCELGNVFAMSGGGSASRVSGTFTRTWSEPELIDLLAQVANGLHFLHSRGMAHLDIKMENIYATSVGESSTRGGPLYKIGDFGLVAFINGERDVSTNNNSAINSVALNGLSSPQLHRAPSDAMSVCSFDSKLSRMSAYSVTEGDNRYVPIDMLCEKRHLREADIFALGASIYELATRKPLPTRGEEWEQLRRGLVEFPPIGGDGAPSASFYSTEFIQLVREMMAEDPTARPTAQQLLSHPLIISYTHDSA